jgi:hypothetical protein
LSKQPTIANQYIEPFRIAVHIGVIDFITRQWKENGKHVKTGKAKHTNPYATGLSIWYILKAETSSGIIQNYRSQLTELAAKCLHCTSSLQKWIAWLRNEGLLHIEGKHLRLHSFAALKKYGINYKQKVEKAVYYDSSENISLSDKLLAIGIVRMQERGKRIYEKKITGNPAIQREIGNHLIAYGADAKKVSTDLDYYRKEHLALCIRSYKEEETGQSSFDLLHKDTNVNPDIQLCTATYGRYMGYSVLEKKDVDGKGQPKCMGFSHLKRKLATMGVIKVRHRHVESEYQARKDEKVFHHRWVKKKRRTIWFLPDEIIINHDVIFGTKNI